VAKSQRVLTLIGIFKVVKAVTLATIATIVVVRGHGFASWVHMVVEGLKIDPGNHRVNALLERVARVPVRTLREISLGTFLYAAVFATEGLGLLLRKHWAEYFTVIITGSFLPIEIYEMVEKLTAVRFGAFLVNAAIVVYLLWNLRRERASKQPAAEAALT